MAKAGTSKGAQVPFTELVKVRNELAREQETSMLLRMALKNVQSAFQQESLAKNKASILLAALVLENIDPAGEPAIFVPDEFIQRVEAGEVTGFIPTRDEGGIKLTLTFAGDEVEAIVEDDDAED